MLDQGNTLNNDITEIYMIRDYVLTDKSFIISTFLRGLYYGDSWFSIIPKAIFMNNYKYIAETLIESSNIKLACLKDDPDVILGYAMFTKAPGGLHWVYVKSNWRDKGIAKSLLGNSVTRVTHLTDLGRKLLTKNPNIIFNPFQLT